MKRNIVLILVLCLSLLATACGGAPVADTHVPANNAASGSTPALVETNPAPAVAPFQDEGKVLLDNEYITITLEGEVEDSYYVGYKLLLENKTSEYVFVNTSNTSVAGYMIHPTLQNPCVNPGMKARAELQFYTIREDSMVTSLADLHDVEGLFEISFNSDGSNHYTGNGEVYPFSIKGREGDVLAAPKTTGQIIADDDMVRMTLIGPFEDDYSVGCKLLNENKTDEYIFINTDNTSVNGFMVYLSMQNATISPGKSAVTKLLAYTSNGDVTSLDDFVNITGSLCVSTNTDGRSHFHGTGITYPFKLDNASTLSNG